MSVIIPVYNAEKYLRGCMDSVLSQTLRELELICVDDGSTDGSAAILEEYAEKDSRVRVLRQENKGAGAARNLGIGAARGEYVAFIDADDWAEKGYCSELVQCADEHSADIVVCRAQRFDDATGEPLPSDWMLKEQYLPGKAFAPEDIKKYIFQFTYGQVWDKLFRHELLTANGIRFPEIRAAEDTSFAYISLLSAKRIAVQPTVLIHYRVNRAGTTSGSFMKYPDAPFTAFSLVYEFLKGSGKYGEYEQSFLNWAMEYLVWQVCNMPDKDIRKRYYDEPKQRWIPELGLDRMTAENSYDRSALRKFRFIQTAPLGLVNTVLNIYKGRKKSVAG